MTSRTYPASQITENQKLSTASPGSYHLGGWKVLFEVGYCKVGKSKQSILTPF